MSAAKHTGRFEIVRGEPDMWLVMCGRHFKASGATYAQAEDEWRKHVHAETGKAPKPLGDTTVERWQP